MRGTATIGLAALAMAAAIAAQSSDTITCYGVDGKSYEGNVKCPDSDTCCNAEATCTPQRLCKNAGQAENMFIRGPCIHDPFDVAKCGSICIVNEGFEGFTFPRVELCSDGSYCCSNVANCCRRNLGIFLDDTGNIISRPSSSTTTSSESSTTTTTSSESSTTTTTTTTSESPSSTSSDSDDVETSTTTQSSAEASGTSGAGAGAGESQNGNENGNNGDNTSGGGDSGGSDMGLKVGLGVGIPVAAILGGLVAWFLIRRRKQGYVPATPPSAGGEQQQPYDPTKEAAHYPTHWKPEHAQQQYGVPLQQQQPMAEMDSRPTYVYEMDSSGAHTPPQQGYYGR